MKWARVKFEEIKKSLEPILDGIGFMKHNVQFIPASGLNGQSILKASKTTCDWYHGKSLIDALNH